MPGSQDDDNYDDPQLFPAGSLPLIILADDLTGACDAAVAFTSSHDPVVIQIEGEPATASGIRAITTESRDLPAPQSELRIRNLVERLPAAVDLFKKIDSGFRGNTAAEVATVLRYASFDLAILTPAYPAVGRTVRDGILYIQDPSGSKSAAIAELLANAGCSLARLSAKPNRHGLADSMCRCIENGPAALLCDASTLSDLLEIVRAARSLNRRVLWIGAAGLAHALAADLPRLPARTIPPSAPGATIFFIGSPHPVSRAQVDHMRRVSPIAEHGSDSVNANPDDLLVAIELGKTTSEEIRRALESYEPQRVGCLFMSGGDTAHFVCRALGIQSLRVVHEFAPGVPVAFANGGPFDGVRVVLKSGGFGEANLLCRLLEAHRATPEVIA